MAHCEVDNFVNTFKFLCSAGNKATLTIEASEGEAFVTLKTGLGHIVPPCLIKKSYRRGPSYQRRQERRKAAWAAAASSSQTTVQEGDENAIAEEASNVLGPAETDNGKNASEPADKAEDDFSGYQTFLDAIEVIEACDMSEKEKEVEKEKVLEARKLALGSSFKFFPP